MTVRSLVFLLACVLGAAASAQAPLGQPGLTGDRPIPYPVMAPPQFERAIEAGTRTRTGHPGPNYWQNSVDYSIRASLDPATTVLSATGTATLTNNSPGALPFVVLKLHQNVHAPGVPRNRPVAITGGVTLSRLAAAGVPLTETSGLPAAGQYRIDGSIVTIALPAPLPSGARLALDMAWSYPVPPAEGAFRQGQDGEVYYLGYWYPQVAVYDDVWGWDSAPYMGMGEHYMHYGTFDVAIDAPRDWLVYATGTLQNPEQVLAPRTRERLAQLRPGRTTAIVRENERGTATAPSPTGRLTWQWRAENVRDFAVSLSPRYVWDATLARVTRNGREEHVLINAFYRPGTASWNRSAEFSAFSIEHLSEMLFPYPWEHMTAVEGIISGGMEYPMMTLIGGSRNDVSLFSVTYHEIAHMWYPMIVGTNEKAYTWIDEGITSYNTNEGLAAFFDGSAPNRPRVDAWARQRQSHYAFAGSGFAEPPMRHNDRFKVPGGTPQVDPAQGSGRVIASYSTPAVMLRALEGLYGRERFFEALNTFGERWAYKHPTPYDLFNTFADVLGENLDWFWTPNFFDTWTLDHAIGAVDVSPEAVTVTVHDLGLSPFPAPVVVTYTDGRTAEQRVPVQAWLSGARTATLTFPGGAVARVEIDPEGYLPDVDPTNNVFVP